MGRCSTQGTRWSAYLPGPIAAGKHTVSAAFVLTSGLPRLADAREASVEPEPGTTRVVHLLLEPGTNQVAFGA